MERRCFYVRYRETKDTCGVQRIAAIEVDSLGKRRVSQ